MSITKFTNAEEIFDGIVSRIRELKGLQSQEQVASALGFKPAAFAVRKARKSIPEKELKYFASTEGVSYQWLLTGKSERDLDDLFVAALETGLEDLQPDALEYLARQTRKDIRFLKLLLAGRICASEDLQREIAFLAGGQELNDFINSGADIVTGRKQALRIKTTQAAEPRAEFKTDSPINELIEKAREILISNDDVIREALRANIIAFHKSISDRHRFDLTIEAQNSKIEALEKKIEAIPRNQNTGTEGTT